MAPSVNRKKQKRRQKQAARLAAEQPPPQQQHPNGDVSTDPTTELDGQVRQEHADSDVEDAEHHDQANHHDGAHEGEDGAGQASATVNGKAPDAQEPKPKKSKKKKKSKKDRSQQDESSTPLSTPSASTNRQPSQQNPSSRPTKKSSKDRIWNTSTQEERENIKKFWLELGEEERRALVKVEKDAVLKKMKEQQKHSCSCTVCGRKRTAIEEELEVLYDAYYEELEQYANNNQGAFENGGPIVPPPRLYQPRLHSLDRHSSRLHGHHHPSQQGRVHEIPDDEEGLEEDYDEDDEDDEPYSDDDLEDEATRNARADFFAFGNSLTVKGNSTLFPPPPPISAFLSRHPILTWHQMGSSLWQTTS